MPDVGLIGDKWGGMKGKNGSEDRVENKRKEAEERERGGGGNHGGVFSNGYYLTFGVSVNNWILKNKKT